MGEPRLREESPPLFSSVSTAENIEDIENIAGVSLFSWLEVDFICREKFKKNFCSVRKLYEINRFHSLLLIHNILGKSNIL